MKSRTHPLIAAYLRNTLSPEQRRAVELWRDESDENRQSFDELRRVWQLTGTIGAPANFETEAEWTKLEAQIANVPQADLRRFGGHSSQWLKIAAVILLLITSSALIYLLLFRSTYHEIHTAETIRHIVLPDNSQVWLNRDSHLTYESDFGSKRSVHLDGEAFFDISHNKNAPFVIHAGNTNIEVLGTSFNVRAYNDASETEVYVIAGKVSMKSMGGRDSVVLTPGLTGTFAKPAGTIMVSEGDSENTIAWKNRELVFRKTPMRKVLKDLRGYFGLRFEVKNDKLLRCRVTATFTDDPTIEQVMGELQVMLNLNIEHRQGMYVIDGLGCE